MDWRGQSLRDVIEQPERWAVGLCAVLVAVLVGTEASGLISALRTPAPTPQAVGNSTSTATDHVGRIAGANLFGAAPVSAGNDRGLPETQLQLTLRGVFTAEDPALASAIIETADGKMQIVKSGGGLGGDASLHAVYANRVVIARGGVMENLYFPTTAAAGLPALPAAVDAPPAATGAGGTEEEERKANILRRLEELRARGALSQ